MQRRQMRNKILNNGEIKQSIDENIDDYDKGAFYFLFVMLVIIVTFSLFKAEILQLIFSHLL
jgi:hypothetical protein